MSCGRSSMGLSCPLCHNSRRNYLALLEHWRELNTYPEPHSCYLYKWSLLCFSPFYYLWLFILLIVARGIARLGSQQRSLGSIRSLSNLSSLTLWVILYELSPIVRWSLSLFRRQGNRNIPKLLPICRGTAIPSRANQFNFLPYCTWIPKARHIPFVFSWKVSKPHNRN